MMSTVSFRSLGDAEAIDIEFLTTQGEARTLKLLVDSGFTGKSSLILGHDSLDLVLAKMQSTPAKGAIQGLQDRGWVTCRIAGLNISIHFDRNHH